MSDPPVAPTDPAYDEAACALLSCHINGQLVRANRTVCRWLGHPATRPPQSLAEVLTSASLLFFEMQLRPLLALGRTVDGAFATLRHVEGHSVAVILNAVQPLGSQTIELAMLQVREREQYEASLRQAHADAEAALAATMNNAHGQKMQAVGQMAAGIAHEFNNLLSVVRGNLVFAQQELQDNLPGERRVQADLADAVTATDRAVGMVRQLLAFTGRTVVRRTELDLNDVVHDAARLAVSSLDPETSWQTALAADLWPVFGASDQLQHVLTALLLNARDAVRATPQPGQITVSTCNVAAGLGADDAVRVSVADTGPGMTDEVRQRAFDPFFTTKPPGEGVGLGLSMAYGAVKALGGCIVIDSAPGCGTTVHVLLPRARDLPALATV
jgi:signal transduction histidine kinase